MVFAFVVSCTKQPDQPIDSNHTKESDSVAQPDGPSSSDNTNETKTPDQTQLDTDENGYIRDGLKDLDFGGQTINIIYWEDVENPEYFVEQYEGSLVDSAIYKRNLNVTNRLKVKLNYIPCKGNSGNYQTFVSKVKVANESGGTDGSDSYDIASAHSRTIGALTYNSLTRNLRTLKYIDFEKPWWSKSLLEQSTINDQLHFASGDISTNVLYMMYVVFYNKQMLADHNLEDPIKFVDSNEWTLEKMFEMSKDCYEDAPGGGQGTKDTTDTFGHVTSALHLDAYLQGSNIICLVKDTNGKLMLSDDYKGEKTMKLIEKISTFFESDAGLIDSKAYKTIFAEGRSLFVTDRADIVITDVKTDEFEIGIVPIPKYDSNQKDYRTLLGNPFSLYSVTRMSKKADMAAAVLECLASESYRLVTPSIFEITMKIKYSAGSEYSKMYDIIRENVVYDLSRVFYKVICNGAIDSNYQDAVSGKLSMAWTTKMRTAKISIEKDIKKIQTLFDSFK